MSTFLRGALANVRDTVRSHAAPSGALTGQARVPRQREQTDCVPPRSPPPPNLPPLGDGVATPCESGVPFALTAVSPSCDQRTGD